MALLIVGLSARVSGLRPAPLGKSDDVPSQRGERDQDGENIGGPGGPSRNETAGIDYGLGVFHSAVPFLGVTISHAFPDPTKHAMPLGRTITAVQEPSSDANIS